MSTTADFERLVHLDLKGAAPKVEYLKQIFPFMKKWGATGVLIEYEDMFPYWGELSDIASEFAYNKEAISSIVQLCEQNGMTVMPLVQSFGHFEFVLKHEKFRSLREVPNYPMALCPSNPDSLIAVCMMIDQVMELHPGIRSFHIGADEVYHIGICDRCKKRMMTENISTQQLFLLHVKAVLTHIKVKYPNITAVMWDDMLRLAELPVLLDSGLDDLVEPMVWHYLTSFVLPPDIWDKFSKVFPNIWFASAFKGATGAHVYATNILYHIGNHSAWLSVIEQHKSKFQMVRGCAITGWQRYDHYAILCELLPQALPSLAICLSVLLKGTFSPALHASISQELNFLSLLPLNPFQCCNPPPCNFPGSDIYCDMLQFIQLELGYKEIVHSERVTWMNDYMMENNFSNPVHLEPILEQSTKLLDALVQLQSRLQEDLSTVFYTNTVEEWLNVYLRPKIKKTANVIDLAKSQISMH